MLFFLLAATIPFYPERHTQNGASFNEMLNVDYAGYTDDYGKFITLFPKAFQNREQLVKTLGHEQIHLQQILKSGKVKAIEELLMREKEAEISENKWWSEYVKRTGYRQKHNAVDNGI